MGVPSFYRWLVNKYPKIVRDAADDQKGGHAFMEFDNFYLDMNGIIHPCFHPEDNPYPPTTFEEVFSSMYEFIDRLFDIVKPKKLLFMAIDGVAPRAKMNQQRARRFRAAKDTEMAEKIEERLRKEFEREGKVVLPKQESQVSDSNLITPGTEFMHMLSHKLQSYISQQMRDNPAWSKIKVILSDDKVPGEGEHKIMSFIRSQRTLPGYDPNTRHCLYGLDADLIMLALATHEINFCILREVVLPQNKQINYVTSLEKSFRATESCPHKSGGWFKEHPWQKSSSELAIGSDQSELCKEASCLVNKKQLYQFLNVCILREYLALDLEIPCSENEPGRDVERLIDDFIFFCFFAGNDFLPHMPTLEIHEGCVDLLIHVYKKEFLNLGGYLVDMQKVDCKKGSYIKLKRVERFILAVGEYEEQIFSKRSQLRERKLRRILVDFREAKEHEKNQLDEGLSSDIVGMHAIAGVTGLKISDSAVDPDTVVENTKELKQKLKECIRSQSDLFKDGCIGTDKVKLGSAGWKERYYKEKFSAQSPQEIEATRKIVVSKYCEGLCWVLLYYFSGVPSWTWYYPFHHGPFASDLRGLTQTKTKFIKGSPFKPFDQLMGVLPPRSCHALPPAFKGLMCDELSSIIDFYPSEFQTDMDGKRFMWQGVCKLPFIDEELLLAETRKLENGLKETDKVRNSQSLDRLFVRCSSKQSLCGGARAVSEKIKRAVTMDSTIEGVKGTLHLMISDDLEGVDDDKINSRDAICMFYEIPVGCRHVPRLLEGVNIPEKTVHEGDIVETTLWHERFGNASSNNVNMSQNRATPIPNFESRSQNPATASISKGAGVGFSLGRGKQSPVVHNPGNSTSSSYRGYGSNDHHAPFTRPIYHGRPEAGFNARGGIRIGYEAHVVHNPGNLASSSYRGYGSNGHHAPFTKPTYHGRPEAGFYARGGIRGGYEAHRNAAHHTSNYRPQQGGNNFWLSHGGVSEDWRSDKWSTAVDNRPRCYARSPVQAQHPNQPFSGRARGRAELGMLPTKNLN